MIAANRELERPADPGRPHFQQFCEQVLQLDGRPVRFDGRPYLREIYAATGCNLVIRSGRQVEKTTFLSFRICYELITRPGSSVLIVCPVRAQADRFIRTRLVPVLQQSPLASRMLGISPRWKPGATLMEFGNGSRVFIASAFRDADSARGISASLLIVDEVQDLATGVLPDLQETMSHAARPVTILTGTSKLASNPLETLYRESTARSWTTRCDGCGTDNVPSPRHLKASGPVCAECSGPIDFASGRWVAANPHSAWGEGFWLPQLIAPWIRYGSIWKKRAAYCEAKYLNEVFGLPTTQGALAITLAELEACCRPTPMAQRSEDFARHAGAIVFAGIDWGAGGDSDVAVVIGTVDESSDRVSVWHWTTIRAADDGPPTHKRVARLCEQFKVSIIAADARGGGAVGNQMLLAELGGPTHGPIIMGCRYGNDDGLIKKDGNLWSFTLDRTKWMSAVFTRARQRLIDFPRAADCQDAFRQIVCEEKRFDEAKRQTTYTVPDHLSDQMLHALTYGLAAKGLYDRYRLTAA